MAAAIEHWELDGYLAAPDRIDVHRCTGGWMTTILHEHSIEDLLQFAEAFGAIRAIPVFFAATAQLLGRRSSSVWIAAVEPGWISYGHWSNDRWDCLRQRRSEDDSPDAVVDLLDQETELGDPEGNRSHLVRVWSERHAPGVVGKGRWQVEYHRPQVPVEPA